jgi:antitoxin HicB
MLPARALTITPAMSFVRNNQEHTVAEYNYTVIFEKLQEGGYQVFVPAIPEIVTYGRTLDEAREMAQDAIRCVLESSRKAGEPIPVDIEPATTERLAVSIP